MEVYVTYQKFIILYRSFMMFKHAFELDYEREKVAAITNKVEMEVTRIDYCLDMIKKFNEREKSFDKIMFNLGSNDYDFGGYSCFLLKDILMITPGPNVEWLTRSPSAKARCRNWYSP